MIDNKGAYSKEKVVKIYSKAPKLFSGEETLIHNYKRELQKATFLDIGVGRGRTTNFIAPLVNKYYGVDYSENFVSFVKERYHNKQNVKVEYGDARSLSQFGNGFFDFILFSFNGIDCVDFNDRRKVIAECFRLLKPGGHFWFSFHNLFSIPKLYSFQWPKNPFKWIREFHRFRKVRALNGNMDQYTNREYCSLYDGAEVFEAEVMYLQPSLQFCMLEEAGFTDIKYYNAQTGKLLSGTEANSRNIDWIYVDCIKS
jgi:ubiquinone/menaquinone biosynthesis C-methylase UbiE